MGKEKEAAEKEKHHGKLSTKLLTLAAIAEGYRKGKDIRQLYDWSKERMDETLEDLESSGYITMARENADTARDAALEITEKGRDEMPKLLDDLGEATRDFFDDIQNITKEHFSEVVPNVEFNFSIEKKDKD